MQIGDHLWVERGVYSHHGIYIGSQRVIHYAGFANGLIGNRRSHITIIGIEAFSQGKPVQIRQHPAHYSRYCVAQRAKSRVGEDKYNLFWRNCEHFATWCWTGSAESPQIKRTLVAGTAALSLGAIALACLGLKSSR